MIDSFILYTQDPVAEEAEILAAGVSLRAGGLGVLVAPRDAGLLLVCKLLSRGLEVVRSRVFTVDGSEMSVTVFAARGNFREFDSLPIATEDGAMRSAIARMVAK